MPNTLAHFAVQAAATRAVVRSADARWILMGCVLPDVPWILQRALRTLVPTIDPYEVRLYAIAQASLAVTLLACSAVAVLSRRPARVFGVLALGTLVHLLLDAVQTKWANGVHLLAPLSWQLLNFGLFWPESWPTVVLTALGLLYFLSAWRQAAASVGLRLKSYTRIVTSAGLACVYFLIPLTLRSGPEQLDNHYVRTLRERDRRPGHYVEFDRASYEIRGSTGILRTFAGEELVVLGRRPQRAGKVSVRAIFVGENEIYVRQIHPRWGGFRDTASILGLLLVTAVWARTLLVEFRAKEEGGQSPP